MLNVNVNRLTLKIIPPRLNHTLTPNFIANLSTSRIHPTFRDKYSHLYIQPYSQPNIKHNIFKPTVNLTYTILTALDHFQHTKPPIQHNIQFILQPTLKQNSNSSYI